MPKILRLSKLQNLYKDDMAVRVKALHIPLRHYFCGFESHATRYIFFKKRKDIFTAKTFFYKT